jgi:hypothetical protein
MEGDDRAPAGYSRHRRHTALEEGADDGPMRHLVRQWIEICEKCAYGLAVRGAMVDAPMTFAAQAAGIELEAS